MDALPFLFGECKLPNRAESPDLTAVGPSSSVQQRRKTAGPLNPLIINRRNSVNLVSLPAIEPTPTFTPAKRKRGRNRAQSADGRNELSEREIRAFVRDFKDELNSNPAFKIEETSEKGPKSAPLAGEYSDKLNTFVGELSEIMARTPSRRGSNVSRVTEDALRLADKEIEVLKEKIKELETGRNGMETIESVKDRYEFQMMELRRQLDDAEVVNAGLEEDLRTLKDELKSMKSEQDLRDIQLKNQQEIMHISAILESRESNINELVQEREANNGQLKMLEKSIAEKEKLLLESKQTIEGLERTIDQLYNEKTEAESALMALQLYSTEIISELFDAEEKLESVRAELEYNQVFTIQILDDLEAAGDDRMQTIEYLNAIEQKNAQAQQDFDDICKKFHYQIEFLENALETEKKLIKSLTFDLKATSQIIDEQELTIQQYNEKCTTLEADKNEMETIIEKLMEETTAIHAQLDQSDQVIDQLQVQLDAQTREMESTSSNLANAENQLAESHATQEAAQRKLIKTTQLFLNMESSIKGVETKLLQHCEDKRRLEEQLEVKNAELLNMKSKVEQLETDLKAAINSRQVEENRHQTELSDANASIADLKQTLSNTKAEGIDLQNQLSQKVEEMQVRKAMNMSLNQVVEHHHRKQCRNLLKQLNQEILNSTHLLDEKRSTEVQNQKLMLEIENLQKQLVEARGLPSEELDIQRQRFEKMMDTMRENHIKEMNLVKQQVQKAQSEISESEYRCDQANERAALATKRSELLESQMREKDSDLVKLHSLIKDSDQKLFSLNQELEDLRDQHQLEIQKLQTENDRLKETLHDTTRELRDVPAIQHNLKHELDQAVEKLGAKERQIEQMKAETTAANAKVAQLEKQLTASEQQLFQSQMQHKKSEVTINRLNQDLKNVIEQEKEQLKEEIVDISSKLTDAADSLKEIATLREENKTQKQDINNLTFAKDLLNEKYTLMKQRDAELTEELESKSDMITMLTQELKSAQAKLKVLKEKDRAPAQDSQVVEKIQKEKVKLNEELQETVSEMKELQFEVEALRMSKRHADGAAVDMAQLRTENSDLQKRLAEQEKAMEAKEEEMRDIESQLVQLQTELKESRRVVTESSVSQMEGVGIIEDLKYEIEDQALEIENLESQNEKLHAEVESLRERNQTLLEKLDNDVKYADVKNIRLKTALQSAQKAEDDLKEAQLVIDEQALELAKSRAFLTEFTKKEFEDIECQASPETDTVGIQSENNDVDDETHVLLMTKDMEIERLLCQLDALKCSQSSDEEQMMEEILKVSMKAAEQRHELEAELRLLRQRLGEEQDTKPASQLESEAE